MNDEVYLYPLHHQPFLSLAYFEFLIIDWPHPTSTQASDPQPQADHFRSLKTFLILFMLWFYKSNLLKTPQKNHTKRLVCRRSWSQTHHSLPIAVSLGDLVDIRSLLPFFDSQSFKPTHTSSCTIDRFMRLSSIQIHQTYLNQIRDGKCVFHLQSNHLLPLPSQIQNKKKKKN